MGYQALLFCPDEKLARVVTQVFSELDFTVEPVNEPFTAVKKLMAQRYDAVVVDCENEPNATLLFKSARNSNQNQSSLALALVEGQAGVAKAYRIGANLVLTKPINVEQAKGTLRVARGLLRKNSDAATAGANTASSATPKIAPVPPSAPFKPVPQAVELPAVTKSVYEPPEFESALPAMAASGEKTTTATPAPESQPRVLAHGDATGKIQHQAPASEPVRPAPPIQPAGFTSPVASHASISGSAAAPAPAKEAPAHVERTGASLPVEHLEVSVPAFGSAGPGSSPSFAALESDDSGGFAGRKKILIVAAAVLVGVALAYFGWTKMGKTAPTSHSAIPPQTQLPTPSTTTATDLPVKPSSSASEPATSPEQSIGPQATKPSASIANTGAIKIGSDTEGVTKKPTTPIVVKSYAPARRTQALGDESAPQVPNPLAVATTTDKGLSSLVSSGTAALPKAPTSMLRISQGVSQGLLIKRVQPRYPQNALSMRIQGSVQLEATIDKEGNISNLKVLSGDPVLSRAATDAVRQWRYKPYYLDGDPVEIQTQITVNFKLPN